MTITTAPIALPTGSIICQRCRLHRRYQPESAPTPQIAKWSSRCATKAQRSQRIRMGPVMKRMLVTILASCTAFQPPSAGKWTRTLPYVPSPSILSMSAPGEITSATSNTQDYLDAITEVCDGDMPVREDCGVAISTYLDALSVGGAVSSTAAGSGIATYLDSFTGPSKETKHSADAVTSYLGDLSSGTVPPPSRESVVAYLDTLSKKECGLSDLFIDKTSYTATPFSPSPTTIPDKSGAYTYLDAISEACEPSKTMDPCVEAVTSYLDTLSPSEIGQTSQSLARPTSYSETLPHPISPTSSSLASSGGTEAVSSPALFRQPSTPEDVALESWYKRHAIATGYVQVRTTEESVGGRGMFFSSPKAAEYAQILARIPKNCVLEAGSSKAKWAEAMNWAHIDDKNLEMMASAMSAYTQVDPTGVDWREWIDTWLGFGGVMPRPLKSYSPDEIQSFAAASGSSFADVSVAIELRYSAMKNDATKLEFPFIDGAKGMTGDIFADMYSVVVSRCAVMGPAWDYAYGIIPMHDMHNHPPPSGVESSVELHAIGDVRQHIDNLDEKVTELIHLSGVADISPPLDDRDILIVARRRILPGEELFLSYRDDSEMQGLTSNDRLWLLFQYGFPLAPVDYL